MTVFFISDTHFGHEGINHFMHHDGTPLRPFNTWMEADMTMVENWNNVVRPTDKVFHLGDVAFSRLGHELVRLLNGKKTLIAGNHDTKKATYYDWLGFENILGVKHLMNGIWLTHIPMHEQCVNEPRVKLNIHGHLHRNFVRPETPIEDGVTEHRKYFNACVENINYTPISLDEIEAKKGL